MSCVRVMDADMRCHDALQVESDIKPFKGLLLGLFFISAGMEISFSAFYQNIPMIIGSLFALIADEDSAGHPLRPVQTLGCTLRHVHRPRRRGYVRGALRGSIARAAGVQRDARNLHGGPVHGPHPLPGGASVITPRSYVC